MLQITHEVIQQLGDGLLFVDGDVLYIVNPQGFWTIAWVGAHRDLSANVRACLALGEEEHLPVDWRVLVATNIDVKTGMFMPPLRHRWVDICPQGKTSMSVVKVREFIETNSELLGSAELCDLSALFHKGKAHPSYGRAHRSALGGKGAVNYTFDFDSKLYAVPADCFKGLDTLGFRLTVPAGQDGIPYTVGNVEEADYPVFCFLAPVAESGTFETPDGRALFIDALQACWATEEEALEIFQEPASHNPAVLDLDEEFLDLVARKPFGSSFNSVPLKRAVSILRWQGWTDEEIEAEYFAQREVALETVVELMQIRAEERRKEIRQLPPNSGGRSRAAQIDREFRSICEVFEKIGEYFEEDMGPQLGCLPDAIRELVESGLLEEKDD